MCPPGGRQYSGSPRCCRRYSCYHQRCRRYSSILRASLTVVDVKAAPVLEGVDGKVEVLPVVVTKVAASSKRSTIKQLDSKGLRLEGTELQGLFSWTASRRMRGRRASEVDTSVRFGCQQWSVFDAVKHLLKSRWRCCSTLVHATNQKVGIHILFAETKS